MKKVDSIEEYIENHENFKHELALLRHIILDTELLETIKWNAPVYTLDGKNVLGLGAFKNHFGIWFFNGVFLKDDKNLLTNSQDGKTKALRQMRFTSSADINKVVVKQYVKEAIENQRLGKEIKPQKTKVSSIHIPSELTSNFKTDKKLEEAYKNLSPYKQKEYSEYISSAKREATRQSRLEKILPMIHKGIGLNDKYKNC